MPSIFFGWKGTEQSHVVPMEDDPRNELYKMYVQFLNKYKPRMFVFENVAGIKTARGGQAFKNLQTYMKRVGYEIDYHELNAQMVLEYCKVEKE